MNEQAGQWGGGSSERDEWTDQEGAVWAKTRAGASATAAAMTA